MVEHPSYYHFPFYRVDPERNRPSLFGSGVLLEIGSHSFLVSAAHVFDQVGDSLSFPLIGLDDPVPIRVSTSDVPPSGRKDDLIDVGIALIPESPARRLRDRFRFVQTSDLDTSDSYSADKKYCFTGYPGNRTRTNFQNRALHIDCYEFRLEAIAVTANTPPWHPALHVAGKFIRDSVRHPNGQRISAPEPYGMSGGGVWTTGPSQGYKLVGLGINWDGANDVLVGVKIGAALCFIRELYPDLRSITPRDPRINIEFRP